MQLFIILVDFRAKSQYFSSILPKNRQFSIQLTYQIRQHLIVDIPIPGESSAATLDVESAKLLTGIFSPACTSFGEFIVNHLKKDIAFIRLDFPDAFAPNTAQARERTTGISPPAENVVSALSAFLSFKDGKFSISILECQGNGKKIRLIEGN